MYVSDIFDPSMAGSMMLHIAYDIDVIRMDDPIIENAEKAVDALTAIGNTGSYLGIYGYLLPFPIKLITFAVDLVPIRGVSSFHFPSIFVLNFAS